MTSHAAAARAQIARAREQAAAAAPAGRRANHRLLSHDKHEAKRSLTVSLQPAVEAASSPA